MNTIQKRLAVMVLAAGASAGCTASVDTTATGKGSTGNTSETKITGPRGGTVDIKTKNADR